MTKPKPCKHRRAWPTIYYSGAGYLWCPDCGATRQIRSIAGGGFGYADDRWLYPRGQADVLKQLERIKRLP
jgi:hypothetical protein